MATGGGGMLAGHFVLPGIGTAIAVGASTFLSHNAANKMAEECDKIEEVNKKNADVLITLSRGVKDASQAKEKFMSENLLLAMALKAARRGLFRFGWLSHLYRLVRSWLGGQYYESGDYPYVQSLDEAVARFYSAFRES